MLEHSRSFLSDDRIRCDLSKNITTDLYSAIIEFDLLGFKYSKQWCTDMLLACKDQMDDIPYPTTLKEHFGDEIKQYLRAKSLFDVEEYERAEWVLKDTVNKGCKVLMFYARYLLQDLSLPNHWARSLFFAHCLNEMQCADEALGIYDELMDVKFKNTCSYITEKRALALWNLRSSATNTITAKDTYSQLRKQDPFNIDYVDHYSNLLFVMVCYYPFDIPYICLQFDRPELSLLAQQCHEVNPYRHETCCVLGNYYSLVKEHGKAVHYYTLALKANPHYVFAWTLIGHECMELKNYSSAVLAYRKAIELDPKEYRAWYGVGQAYEIMKMPKYSLYYYMKAHEIRPLDARFLVALGDAYIKLANTPDAIRCFWKAYCVGDAENLALTRLAISYRQSLNDEAAVRLYLRYLEEIKSFVNLVEQDELCDILRYLGSYYERQDDLTGLEAVLRWGLNVTKNPIHSAALSPVISQLAAITTNEINSRTNLTPGASENADPF